MRSALRTFLARRRPFRYVGAHVHCNLCGGDDFLVVGRRDRWFNRLVNVMCRRCGLIFLDPMPTADEVDRYYAEEYRLHYQGVAEPTPKHLLRSTRGAEGRLRNLAPILKPGMRILDVGAGSGEFLAVAQRAGYTVEGVEPDPNFAAYAKRAYGVKVHALPLQEVDFGGGKFDLITSWHAVEHLRDPLGAIRHLHRLLVPGGYLHLAVPDMAEPGRTPFALFHAAHLHGFTHETLEMMAARGGFSALEQKRSGTILLFRRLDGPDPGWFRYPGHARELEALFKRRTLGRFLMSGETYLRFFRRMRYFLGDYRTLRRAARGRKS